jgi:hypothetical protein
MYLFEKQTAEFLTYASNRPVCCARQIRTCSICSPKISKRHKVAIFFDGSLVTFSMQAMF